MKAYKTKEINAELDNPSWDDNTLVLSIPEYTMEEAIKLVGHQFKIKQ